MVSTDCMNRVTRHDDRSTYSRLEQDLNTGNAEKETETTPKGTTETFQNCSVDQII